MSVHVLKLGPIEMAILKCADVKHGVLLRGGSSADCLPSIPHFRGIAGVNLQKSYLAFQLSI